MTAQEAALGGGAEITPAAPAAVTLWHVVGDADLGLHRAEHDEGIRRRDELRVADLATKSLRLHEWRRSEAQHGQLAALESALIHTEIVLSDLNTSGVWEVVLVATRQRSHNPRDTAAIAEALRQVIEDDPTSFGRHVVARVAVVEEISIDAFARAATSDVSAFGAARHTVIALAGGAAIATVGVLGGLLAAGVRPTTVEANRQDRDFDVSATACRITPDVNRWLARTRRYDQLARGLDGDERRIVEVMAAALRLDWQQVADHGSIGRTELRQLAAQFDVPRSKTGRPLEPRQLQQWASYQTAVARALAASVASHRRIAGPLIDAYLRTTIGHAGAMHPEAAAIARRDNRIDAEIKGAASRLQNVGWRAAFAPLRHEQPELAVDALTEMLLDAIRPSVQKAVSRAVDGVSTLDLADIVLSWQAIGDPTVLPGPLRPFALPPWPQLRQLATSRRHRLSAAGTEAGLLVQSGLIDDDLERSTLVALGLPAPIPLERSDRLVIVPVGLRQVAEDDPMLAAIFSALGTFGRTHLRFVCSAETAPVAASLSAQANRLGSAGAESIEVSDPHGVAASALSVATGLARTSIAGLEAVHIFLGPATKAINVGTVVAGIEYAFEVSSTAEVWALREDPDRPGGSLADRSAVASSGWRRLVPDELVGALVKAALARLDFPVAVETLRNGSRVWQDALQRVRQLEVLVEHGLSGDTSELEALQATTQLTTDELVAARIRLQFALRRIEPRFATIRTAVTISDWTGDEGPEGWQYSGPNAQRLWGLRVDAMKKPWADVDLAPVDVRALLQELGLPCPDRNPLEEWRESIGADVELLVESLPTRREDVPLSQQPAGIG